MRIIKMVEPCSANGEILSGILAAMFLLSEYIGLSKCKSGSIFEIIFNGLCLKWSITKVNEDQLPPVLVDIETSPVAKTVSFEKTIDNVPIDI